MPSPMLEFYYIYKKLFLSLQKSQKILTISEKHFLKVDTKV
ncbi:hypothetical protein CWATWH8502_1129 [Crocosphaera watsonii WH 8502]|uniref:Uncharacterized protein n=4 Tax=Crocosphaera watsonii TaxID=263511 RepID=T2JL95_CROWT|nr:hypothetical protein CWATWH8502_1129 [Crocosphaera watsonii WH 8502]CCQ56200.1 hypothetical protein CWATWH0005_328 [Crocosphaera watsonii WH 0005]CCQ60775.1 hypothetical protein CWATWH0401_4972 [Crocosphaera watsonii WH 0401]CCQ65282.1 hypothetical protein CWATWH0402_2781 [Crocosphaera watsonii WH 0402]